MCMFVEQSTCDTVGCDGWFVRCRSREPVPCSRAPPCPQPSQLDTSGIQGRELCLEAEEPRLLFTFVGDCARDGFHPRRIDATSVPL